MLRQRHLAENSGNGWIGNQCTNSIQQFCFGNRFRKTDNVGTDPDFVTILFFTGHINLRSRIVSDQDGGEFER